MRSKSVPQPVDDRDGALKRDPRPPVLAGVKTTTSAVLFEGHREILIEHADGLYRLRITQSNKLILTK